MPQHSKLFIFPAGVIFAFGHTMEKVCEAVLCLRLDSAVLVKRGAL